MQIKLTKPDFLTFTSALILGSLGMGFAPAATAASSYDAFAEFTLTLTGVSACCGGSGNWTVEGSGDGVPFLYEAGDATATGEIIVADTSIGIGESIYQSSSSSGIAYNGIASTDALSDLTVTISNISNTQKTFDFDWSYDMFAATTTESAVGDAEAYAAIDLLGDRGLVDLFVEVGAMSGPGVAEASFMDASDAGMLSITLAGGETFTIDGYIDTYGSATAVPVPAAVWLFGSGLLGLVAMARRRTKAA